jgi:hypothetical protein
MVASRIAAITRDKVICEKIPDRYPTEKTECLNNARFNNDSPLPEIDISGGRVENEVSKENVLLQNLGDGQFKNVAQAKGVTNGLWAWNSAFADLDNDEWQDLYIANGFLPLKEKTTIRSEQLIHSNVFFHNQGGDHFIPAQKEFGLDQLSVVPAYTYVDIDNDGDLDIVSVSLNGPLSVYLNNEQVNNSVIFQIRDHKGNSQGVGGKIYIYYGDNEHQVREIKLGGGYLSYDATIAHFGLGQHDSIDKIEIIWSTGEKTSIEKEFQANNRYIIIRK